MNSEQCRPLLIVDGDSFAHRAYHGLPKTIRRPVLVGWDTLDAPNFRSRLFPPYQGGRVFDEELLDQLALLPDFVAACGFLNARAAGYEADDFLAAAVAQEEGRGGRSIVASV